MREEDLRDVFDALHAGEDPDLGFSAADVVHAGERVRRRHRAVVVVGTGLATAAAVVVAVVLLPGGHGDVPRPVGPAVPDTGRTTTSTDTVPPTRSPVTTTPTIGTSPAGSSVQTTPGA